MSKTRLLALFLMLVLFLSACNSTPTETEVKTSEPTQLDATEPKQNAESVDATSGATQAAEDGQEDQDSLSGVVRDTSASGIYTRTSTKEFASAPVSDEQIEKLIEAAFASPTGGGQRAWEFYIVTDREVMEGLQAGHPYSDALDNAPLCIVIACNEELAKYTELFELDSGIAAQSIMVQAAELGLSTRPMSITPQEERIEGVSNALNLPDYIVPQIMIAIGYPESDAVTSASVVFYDDAKIHYNQQ